MSKREVDPIKPLTRMQKNYLEKLNAKVGALIQTSDSIQKQLEDARNDLLSYLEILREIHQAPKEDWIITNTEKGFERIENKDE
jgi:hypothetical protein